MSEYRVRFESPDGKSGVAYDDEIQAQAARLVHEIGYKWGERRGLWEGAVTGALLGLILGIVLTLIFTPGWVC